MKAETPTDPKALLTPKQVADMLGMKIGWVLDHASRKEPRLRCVRLGTRMPRFRRADVEAFIEEHLK